MALVLEDPTRRHYSTDRLDIVAVFDDAEPFLAVRPKGTNHPWAVIDAHDSPIVELLLEQLAAHQ